MTELNIVIAQLNTVVGDIQNNTDKIISSIQTARDQYNADVLLLPELALTSYPPEDLLLRPGFYLKTASALMQIVEQTQGITAIVGYPERVGTDCFNMAAVIRDGEIIAKYAKQLLPNYTVFDEKRYFKSGTSPCVFELNGIRIGVCICEDLWHEGPVEQAVEHGAQIILSPNASPFDRTKVRSRQNALEIRARASNIPIVYCNIIGGQDELVFDGGSMVIGANGARLHQADYYKEHLMPMTVRYDNDTIQIAQSELPARLTEEENLYKALILGIRDYVEKNQFPGVLIGLSGGIDSALTLALAYDALGPNRVHTVMMPSRFTSALSKKLAQTQADLLDVNHSTIEIDALFDAYMAALDNTFADHQWSAAEENIQARIRGNILMAISNKNGFMVLSTGNKSELSVGYTTLYGDMSGGFAPLKDIPKTMVYRLAQYRNTLTPGHQHCIPDEVIERAPTAELATDQKDQDTLPPYTVLDEILYRYIDQDQSPDLISDAGFCRDTVDRVVRMINRSEYKRRQAPIGIRTTQRAFGKDRRYPITSGYGRNAGQD